MLNICLVYLGSLPQVGLIPFISMNLCSLKELNNKFNVPFNVFKSPQKVVCA